MIGFRSITGAPLVGDILVRSIYLDEAGISRHTQEPVLTVAGVIVHTDTQWRPLHEHFQSLINEFVPEERRDSFIFHTHEIVHGAGIFDPKRYQRDRREILRALCDTLVKFQLPIVWGVARRAEIENVVKSDPEVIDVAKATTEISFMSAFSAAAYHCDVWMKEYAPDECANLVMENNNELKKYARLTFKKMKAGELARLHASDPDRALRSIAHLLEHLNLNRIIDVPTFMEKEDAPPLQLADFCAYMIKRYRAGRDDVQEYMVKIFASMMYGPFKKSILELIAKGRAASSSPESSQPS